MQTHTRTMYIPTPAQHHFTPTTGNGVQHNTTIFTKRSREDACITTPDTVLCAKKHRQTILPSHHLKRDVPDTVDQIFNMFAFLPSTGDNVNNVTANATVDDTTADDACTISNLKWLMDADPIPELNFDQPNSFQPESLELPMLPSLPPLPALAKEQPTFTSNEFEIMSQNLFKSDVPEISTTPPSSDKSTKPCALSLPPCPAHTSTSEPAPLSIDDVNETAQYSTRTIKKYVSVQAPAPQKYVLKLPSRPDPSSEEYKQKYGMYERRRACPQNPGTLEKHWGFLKGNLVVHRNQTKNSRTREPPSPQKRAVRRPVFTPSSSSTLSKKQDVQHAKKKVPQASVSTGCQSIMKCGARSVNYRHHIMVHRCATCLPVLIDALRNNAGPTFDALPDNMKMLPHKILKLVPHGTPAPDAELLHKQPVTRVPCVYPDSYPYEPYRAARQRRARTTPCY